MDKRTIWIARREGNAIPWPLIAELDGACFRKRKDPALDKESPLAWVAGVGELLVGYSVVERFSETQLYINRQGVQEGYRGHGIQRRMLAAICRYAAGRGLAVVSYTHPDNCPSSNNFIATGFETHHVPGYSDQGWVCWRKAI
jgi:ribosomal protein S18 acetylase RimI-like enzyme